MAGSSCIMCNWKSGYVPRRTFHKFPTNMKERKKWLNFVGKKKCLVGKSSTICSIHFRRSSYVTMKNGKMLLKAGSVPSLNVNRKDGTTMQAKLNAKSNLKRCLFKCGQCNQNFQTKRALQSHLRFKHKMVEEPTGKEVLDNTKEDKVMPITNETDTETTEKGDSVVSFACPICKSSFKAHFMAIRHIAKYHRVNYKGEKVPPNSPDIVAPIEVEQWIKREETSKEPHKPLQDPPAMCNDKLLCLGCHQEIDNMNLFELHLKGMHREEFESFFLPKRSDFPELKASIENELKANYITMSKASTDNKTQIYHCTYQPPIQNDNLTQLCPSTITVKELPDGFHVNYYKTHAEHSTSSISLPDKFKKFTITQFFNDIDNTEVSIDDDEKDLYLQFKRLMNNIVIDAAKINVSNLKHLVSKAMQMITVLNSYDEDDETHVVKQRITDAEITTALEDANLLLKRKSLPDGNKTKTNDTETKRIKRDMRSNDEKTEKNGDVTVPVSTMQSPSSFNDSYKHFVDENFKTIPVKKYVGKKKEVMKTKIGQFKPSLSPKKEVDVKPSTQISGILRKKRVWKIKPDIKYEVKEQENDCNILILKI